MSIRIGTVLLVLLAVAAVHAADGPSQPAATVGSTLPDFQLKDLDGKAFSLAACRTVAAEDAWKQVAAAASKFGAPDAKPETAIDALPGLKGDDGALDAEARTAFLQEAGRSQGLIADEKTGAEWKTLADVSAWVAKSAEAPIVFVVWSSKCPTSVGYEERVVALMAKTGARVYVLASNQLGETDVEAKTYVEAKGLPYRVLSDREQVACKLLGGTRTPHVFLVDEKNRLRYSGSIDNDPPGEKDEAARANWLEDAIGSVAAHREVNVLMTSPKG